MMRFLLLISFSLLGCGRIKPADPKSTPLAAPLQALYETNLASYTTATVANHAWPSVTDCDGTVWAGTAALGAAPAWITLAEWNPGEIHRRPQASGECYPAGSSSTVSRDDLVLYMAGAFDQKNTPALQRLNAYAAAHPAAPASLGSWMGEPHDPNLTLMTPTEMTKLSRSIGESGGVDLEAPGTADYQDNIEVEEILLSTAVNGGANGWELALLESLEAQYPNDALFQAAKGVYSGDCTAAAQLLLASPTPIPTYVRGDEPVLFAQAWWLRAATLVLSHCKET